MALRSDVDLMIKGQGITEPLAGNQTTKYGSLGTGADTTATVVAGRTYRYWASATTYIHFGSDAGSINEYPITGTTEVFFRVPAGVTEIQIRGSGTAFITEVD